MCLIFDFLVQINILEFKNIVYKLYIIKISIYSFDQVLVTILVIIASNIGHPLSKANTTIDISLNIQVFHSELTFILLLKPKISSPFKYSNSVQLRSLNILYTWSIYFHLCSSKNMKRVFFHRHQIM